MTGRGDVGFLRATTRLGAFGWYFLNGVDVQAPGSTGAVVAFGDSITDGFAGVGTPHPASCGRRKIIGTPTIFSGASTALGFRSRHSMPVSATIACCRGVTAGSLGFNPTRSSDQG